LFKSTFFFFSFFTECEFDGAENHEKDREREGILSISNSGLRPFLVIFWLGYELGFEEEKFALLLSASSA
jgi:hypothetical protein